MAEFDPDAYLASAPKAFDPDAYLAQPSVAGDVAKSTGIGLVKGGIGIAGLPGDLSDLGAQGIDYLTQKVGGALGMSPDQLRRPGTQPDITSLVTGQPAPRQTLTGVNFPGAESIRRGVESITGPLYEPKTTAGQYAQTVGEFVPAALGGPETLVPRLIKQAVIPGLASEAAGQATEGTAAKPYAQIAGAIAGGVGAPALASAARRVITPAPTTAARQAAADLLQSEGVPLTAGQKTGSTATRYLESSLGDAPFAGNQATKMVEKQQEAFTAAVMKRAGENATRATPEAIDSAFTRIGNQFDDLAQRNTLTWDKQIGNELKQTQTDYNRMVPPNARAPVVKEMIKDMGDVAAKNGGAIPGDQYQAFRSRLDKAARATKISDPQLSEALFDVRNSLDSAMERSISPGDKSAWQQARRQYKNMLVIERAATGAGENAAQGLISPAALRNATVVQGRRAYARGQGDFANLAHAGETLMRPMPQSGTAPRAFAAAMPAIIGAGLAGGPGAAAGAAASVVAPGMAGRALMSRPIQAYLGNQLLQPPKKGLSFWNKLLLSGTPASITARLPVYNAQGQ